MAKEKRFAATAKKRKEARKRGEVAKSSLLTPALILAILPWLGRWFYELLQILSSYMQKSLSTGADFHTKDLLVSAQQSGMAVAFLLLGILCLCGFMSLIVELLQVGFYVIPGQLWQVQKLQLFSGLRQLFSINSPQSWLITGIRLFVLFGFWLFSTWFFFSRHIVELLSADLSSLEPLVRFVAAVLFDLCLCVSIGAFTLAALDYLYARHSLLQRLKMDREEVKQEFKDTEGNPEVQSMRKQLHLELLAQEAVASVRNSKVVVTD